MVEIKGERVLAPSCCRAADAPAWRCTSDSARARAFAEDGARAAAVRHAGARLQARLNELDHWAAQARRRQAALRARARSRRADLSHPAMAVNLDACIQCTRCVRACREEQVNDVIGYAFRGDACEDRVRPRRPDGRLDLRRLRRMRAGLPDRRADAGARRRRWSMPTRRSIRSARICGVGCQLTYNVKDNKIVRVEGRDGPANHERLCVKGRFGFDYAHHPQRLTKPLIRKRRRAEDAPTSRSTRHALVRRVPRSDLGRGARRSPAASCAQHPRHARPEGAGRLRLGQGQQRGGLPVPEAGAHRLRHATTSTTARACATRRAWRRCSKASARARCRTR